MATHGKTLHQLGSESVDVDKGCCGDVHDADRRHGGQGQGVRASSPARWATKSALAVVAVVTTANLATRLAFSETAVRSRVARAMDQSSIPSHNNEPLVGTVAPPSSGR